MAYASPPPCWPCAGTVEALVRPPGEPWRAPEPIGSAGYRGLVGLQTAVDDHGGVVAVWEPGELANPPAAGLVDVALDDAGRAVAIWQESGGGDGPRLVAATRPAGGPWSAPAPVVRAEVENPRIGVDAAGDALLAYVQNGLPRAVARDAATGAWGRPTGLAPAGETSSLTSAVGADGSAAVAWARGDRVYAAVRSAGGAWSGAHALSDAAASAVRVAVADDGTVVATWSTSAGSVEAAVQPAGGAWDEATTLGPGAGPALDAGGAGSIVAARATDAAVLLFASYEGDGSGVATVAPAAVRR